MTFHHTADPLPGSVIAELDTLSVHHALSVLFGTYVPKQKTHNNSLWKLSTFSMYVVLYTVL